MDMNKLLIDRAQPLSNEKKLFGRTNIGAFNSEGVADEFSTESTYAVGQLVTYQTELYRCKVEVQTAGPWNASNWNKIKVIDAFKLAFATHGTTTYATIKSELDAGKVVFLNHTLTGGEVIILSTSGYKEVSGVGFIDFIGIQSGNVSNKDLIYRTRISSDNTWSEVTSGPIGGDLTESDLGNIIASIYNQSSTYTKGQYVIYNKRLYRCKSETSGQWDGTKWDSTHSTDIFSGSTPGLVPAAESGDSNKVLKGDGTWTRIITPTDTFDGSTAGLVPVKSGTKTVNFVLNSLGSWTELQSTTDEEIEEMFEETVEIGGKSYKTIKIGNQTWIACNLDYKADGISIGPDGWLEEGAKAAWYYNNNEIQYGWDGRKDGLLYNWFAAKYLNDNRSTLFPGWHIPTKEEFQTLATSVGGINTAGTALKSTDYWTDGAGLDTYGFNAHPTGSYSYASWRDSFVGINMNCHWITTNVIDVGGYDAYEIVYFNADSNMQFSNSYTTAVNGYGIRLVKDT